MINHQNDKLYLKLKNALLQDLTGVNAKVMIFFDNSVDSFSNPIQPCTSVDECVDICESHPQACASPVQATKLQRDGVWSRERQNNPFADYFKVNKLGVSWGNSGKLGVTWGI